MRRFLTLMALSLLAPAALAVPVQVTWTLPTARVDGTALPASELAKTAVEWGTCGTDTIAQVAGSVDVASPGTAVSLDLAPGQVCVRAYVVDTMGRQSDYSGTVMATVLSDSPPGAPLILEIAMLPLPPQDYVAYSPKGYKTTVVRKVEDGQIVPIGGNNLVAAGSPCNCSVISVLDADGNVWCSVEGQIQTAFSSGPVAKGEAFPAGSVATCRASA